MLNDLAGFIEYMDKSGGSSLNTIKSYTSDLHNFIQFLKSSGIESVIKINQTNIMAYLLKLQKDNKSGATVSRNLASIKRFCKYLYVEKLVETDYARDIKSLKTEKKLPKVLTVEQVKQLLEVKDNNSLEIRDRAIIELIYATGIKATELINLKIDDISFAYKYIKIGDKNRVVPISPKASEILTLYIEESRTKIMRDKLSDFLFINYNGEAISRQGLWMIIKKQGKKAGIKQPVTPQLLRHSFAAHMARGGADVCSLKEMLGYTNILATQVYMDLNRQKLQDVCTKAHPRY